MECERVVIRERYPSAPTKGQPRIVPAAVARIAIGTLLRYQAPRAIMTVYMVNDEGRRAVLEINMPVLKTRRPRVIRPVFAPN